MARLRTESIALHASALFGAISLAIAPFGCDDKPAPPPQVEVTIPPAPTAEPATTTPSPEPSPAPSAIATADPAPAPEVSASASVMPSAAPAAPRPSAKPRNNPPKWDPKWVEGRPFLVDNIARLAALGTNDDWADVLDFGTISLQPATREALIHHYTAWALAEHASIASFSRFTLHLLALGAPPHLIVAASRAIEDEARHARLGFSLITALSGSPIGPAELQIEGALESVTLEDVLRLTVREGVVGETLAALEARISADLVLIPELKAPLEQLAEEESRHAELAFAFAAWAIRKAPELGRVIREEIESWQPPRIEASSGLEEWGVLDATTRQSVRHEGFDRVVRPLAQKLSRGFYVDRQSTTLLGARDDHSADC